MILQLRTASSLLSLALLVALGACGESHTTDDSGTIAPDGSTDGGGTDGDAPDSNVADTGGGFTDGSGPVDSGGGVVDGGPVDSGGGVVDGGGPVDSGPGEVTCGDTTCNAATEQCCVSGGAGGATSTCIPAGDMCMGAVVDCDGPEDCPGAQVCCASRGGTGIGVSCVDADMCGGFTGFELCHAATDCADPMDMCCPVMAGGFSGSFCQAMCFGGAP